MLFYPLGTQKGAGAGKPGPTLTRPFVNEAKDLSKKVEQMITGWKASDNDGIHLGKKTSASLELLREALTDKINDVNETWENMAGNNEGNKITQNTLSRAVNREKKKTKNGQY